MLNSLVLPHDYSYSIAVLPSALSLLEYNCKGDSLLLQCSLRSGLSNLLLGADCEFRLSLLNLPTDLKYLILQANQTIDNFAISSNICDLILPDDYAQSVVQFIGEHPNCKVWYNDAHRWLRKNEFKLRPHRGSLDTLQALAWHCQHRQKTILNLSDLGLFSLPGPSHFSHLFWTGLTELNLSHNKLTSLPSYLAQLQLLTCLDVSQNEFEQPPLWLGGMKNLNFLDVRGNPWKILDMELLRFIDLGGSQLVHYLSELNKNSVPRTGMQLIVTGHEDVGKTSIIKAIQEDVNWYQFNPLSIHLNPLNRSPSHHISRRILIGVS